jgi:hypothetical protein
LNIWALPEPKKGQGWREVGVIQNVEELRPELHVEGFGNLLHREVLMHREVDVEQTRADDAVAAGIT